LSFYLPLFKSLNDAEVKYVVVGGIATILHGYVRATADVDLVVDLHVDEATKVIEVLSSAGFKPKVPVKAIEFADVAKREQWIQEKGMMVFSLYHPENPGLSVDLFVKPPIPFDDLWSRSVIMDLEETDVRVCSIDDLITMKQSAGRHKDLADVEQLIRIKKHEGQK